VRGSVDRRGIHPFEIVARRIASEITRVAEGQFFVQRVRGLDDLELSAVERGDHLEDVDGNRFVDRSESPAVSDHHYNKALPAAHRGDRVGINRRIVVVDRGELPGADVAVLRAVDDIGAFLDRVLDEGFQTGSQAVHRRVPSRLVRISRVHQALQRRDIGGA